jgi:thiosulfate/3-mercaptopyruvate sulfurtransferase
MSITNLLYIVFFICLLGTLESQNLTNDDWDLQTSWIVSPRQAKSILNLPGTLILDSRNSFRRLRYSLPVSNPINWQDWSEEKSPHKGKILSKEKGISILSKYNLKEDSWILVIGAGMDGWGEEGRLVYTLREWGFKRAYWVDGGDTHFLKEKSLSDLSLPKIYKPNTEVFSVTKEVIQSSYSNQSIAIIDTREEREYKGSTPYGEDRGGHIPGAKWIYFKDFLRQDGRVKSKEEIKNILIKNNINNESSIISYCTGGVRSALVTGILLSYGYSAKNYAGSMWEWSAGIENIFPLEK